MTTVDRAAARERLRQVIREIESRPPRRTQASGSHAAPRGLDAEWNVIDGVHVRDRLYGPGHLHGDHPLDRAYVDRALLELLHDDEELGEGSVESLRFVDIEATGLGGTGAVVFLVGVGRWTADGFELRQYLAPSPAAEGALIRQLAWDCRRDLEPIFVTYNGSTYDTPLLDSRGTMHRIRTGFDALPNLDLLKVVRRGLGAALRPHRLSYVEATLLGVVRHEDEVGGADVPGWYFRFLRTGDPRMLTPIIEHNAADVLSLAGLLARLGRVRSSSDVSASPLELLLLGRLHARHGDYETALLQLGVARAGLRSRVTRELVGLEMARMLRRLGRRSEASALWRELADGLAAPVVALVELSKHFEHHERDLQRALEAVDRAIMQRGSDPLLMHRRARIQRRLRAIER